MRNKIKMFAQTKVTLPPGKHKVVILDEADRYLLAKGYRPLAQLGLHPQLSLFSVALTVSMTKAAQQALRRTMELYSSSTRFALACNNSTKIIEPIQVRVCVRPTVPLTMCWVLQADLHSPLPPLPTSPSFPFPSCRVAVRFFDTPSSPTNRCFDVWTKCVAWKRYVHTYAHPGATLCACMCASTSMTLSSV